MGWPVRFRFGKSEMNWHGDRRRSLRGKTRRNTIGAVQLGSHVLAFRFMLYGSRGQWWHLDIFFPWFKGKLP